VSRSNRKEQTEHPDPQISSLGFAPTARSAVEHFVRGAHSSSAVSTLAFRTCIFIGWSSVNSAPALSLRPGALSSDLVGENVLGLATAKSLNVSRPIPKARRRRLETRRRPSHAHSPHSCVRTEARIENYENARSPHGRRTRSQANGLRVYLPQSLVSFEQRV
jgi:hypothetical protein